MDDGLSRPNPTLVGKVTLFGVCIGSLSHVMKQTKRNEVFRKDLRTESDLK
jgi:hypothetical protein